MRKIIGIISLLIGLGLLGYGYYGKQEIASARQQIASAKAPTEGILPENPVSEYVEKPIVEGQKAKYSRQVDQYELPVNLLLIGGGVFTLIGILLLVIPGRKR